MPLRPPTPHSPWTYWRAYHMDGEGRTRGNSYLCFVGGAHRSPLPDYPGIGATERQALLAACYWPEQRAHVRIATVRKAPQWLRAVAERHARTPGRFLVHVHGCLVAERATVVEAQWAAADWVALMARRGVAPVRIVDAVTGFEIPF
jgi:hypothetical protein